MTDHPADDSATLADEDEGPGCMPAVLAASALMGVIGFVFCAFSTWLLFQQRTELAIRTLRGAYISEIQQSHLQPDSKAAVVQTIETLAKDLERGKYEDWQAAGMMQRLQRLPVIQWGELQAVEAFLESTNSSSGRKQISRLQRAVESGKVTSFDFEDVLQPVRQPDSASPGGYRLMQPLSASAVDEVIQRARLLADRSKIPDEEFAGIRIEAIVQRQIQLGASEGGF